MALPVKTNVPQPPASESSDPLANRLVAYFNAYQETADAHRETARHEAMATAEHSASLKTPSPPKGNSSNE